MRRGEIWRVDFHPQVGAEIQKVRPAVIVSVDGIGNHPLRMVVPITQWQPEFASWPWMVQLLPSWDNGLEKTSAANAFQTKSLSTERFKDKIGQVTPQELVDIVAAVVLVVGHRCG
jgi:mRNA interferase MazF